MFREFSYEKTLDEIKEAMTKKIAALRSKVIDRESRIVRIREEFSISDADMIDLLAQAAHEAVSNRAVKMSYNIQATNAPGGDGGTRIIQAGVVQNLLTEKTLIEQERESVEQLERIVRNLVPVTHHAHDGTVYMQTSWTLNENELEFLGF
jgi:hypothetical protein